MKLQRAVIRMKTNFSLRIFKISALALLGIAIVGLTTQSVSAGAINSIVFTENSSTILTVTYNGSTSGIAITFLGNTPAGQAWKVTFPSTVSFTQVGDSGVPVFWAEPDNSSQDNAAFFHPSSDVVFIFSDHLHNEGQTVPNGSTVPGVGTDSSNGGPISATFNDKGDAAGVPDAGTPVGLLSLALTTLLSANGLRHFQLAKTDRHLSQPI